MRGDRHGLRTRGVVSVEGIDMARYQSLLSSANEAPLPLGERGRASSRNRF